MGTCDYLRSVTGQQLLFVGTNSEFWTDTQFTNCAKDAKAFGFDCVLLKVADGTQEWYGGAVHYPHVRQLFLDQGVGVIPYVYSYGNHYGNYLDLEMTNGLAYLQYGGIVCFDMEAEYDVHPEWANTIANHFKNAKGTILISTWANPQSHSGWKQIVPTLDQYVAAWMPQVYSNTLDQLVDIYAQYSKKCIQPTVMIGNWAGPNNPIVIASRARSLQHTALSIWYYESCISNPPLTRAILAAFPKILNSPQQEVQPMPVVQVKLNDAILKALTDQWNSTAQLFQGLKSPPFDQTFLIVKYWIASALNGHKLGPPITEEYESNDWNVPSSIITVQDFSSGRIEYNANAKSPDAPCRVFTAFGELSTAGWIV